MYGVLYDGVSNSGIISGSQIGRLVYMFVKIVCEIWSVKRFQKITNITAQKLTLVRLIQILRTGTRKILTQEICIIMKALILLLNVRDFYTMIDNFSEISGLIFCANGRFFGIHFEFE